MAAKTKAKPAGRRPKGRRQLSPEHRAKLSAAKKGRPLSPEHRAKLSAARKGRKFGPHSAERRANIAAALSRPEVRAKLSAAHKGKKRGPEATANIAAANRRPEKRAKQSADQKGKKRGPEATANIAAANRRPEKRAKQSATLSRPEVRAKLSAAHKGALFVPPSRRDEYLAFLEERRAGRPGPPTPSKPRLARIRLGKPRQPAYIDDRPVKPLTDAERAILLELAKAGDRGLDTQDMEIKSERGGWRITLRRLKSSDVLWDRIIVFPGRSHGRYRLDGVVIGE
jgi:hypothetical protein